MISGVVARSSSALSSQVLTVWWWSSAAFMYATMVEVSMTINARRSRIARGAGRRAMQGRRVL
jgi:hypothetical protein